MSEGCKVQGYEYNIDKPQTVYSAALAGVKGDRLLDLLGFGV